MGYDVASTDVAERPATLRPRPRGLAAPKAGIGLVYFAAVTIPWSGFRLHGFAFGDIFLVLAAVALVGADLSRPLPKFPAWVWFFVGTVLLTGVANQLFPASPEYFLQRNQLLNNYIVVHSAIPQSTNLTVMGPMVVRLVLLTLVFGIARGYDPRAPFRFAMAFVVGVSICALVAFSDSRGWTSIGASVVGVPAGGGRSSGLTQSPNGVAMICVFALPLAIWRAQATRGSARAIALVGLASTLLGLYASGSRSGAAAAGITGLISLALLPGYRRHLTSVMLGLSLVGAGLFVADPPLGTKILSGLRLANANTTGSDQARSIVNTQGLHDFLHSPIFGVGFGVSEQAHIVYLQALAVGGVLLLAGLVIYLGGALVRSARLARQDSFAVALFASVVGGVLFNAFQNALTPTFVYFIDALVSALPLCTGGLVDERSAAR